MRRLKSSRKGQGAVGNRRTGPVGGLAEFLEREAGQVVVGFLLVVIGGAAKYFGVLNGELSVFGMALLARATGAEVVRRNGK